MKIRFGFVSNSSSSSFIAIGQKISNSMVQHVQDIINHDSGSLVIDDKGHTQFGWESVRYTGFWDRLNFTMLQIMYKNSSIAWKDSNEYMMLKDVLKNRLNINEIINKLSFDYDCKKSEFYAYIDHQSSIGEGENGEMLESIDSLDKFLFSDESYIQGGNDNIDWYNGDVY